MVDLISIPDTPLLFPILMLRCQIEDTNAMMIYLRHGYGLGRDELCPDRMQCSAGGQKTVKDMGDEMIPSAQDEMES